MKRVKKGQRKKRGRGMTYSQRDEGWGGKEAVRADENGRVFDQKCISTPRTKKREKCNHTGRSQWKIGASEVGRRGNRESANSERPEILAMFSSLHSARYLAGQIARDSVQNGESQPIAPKSRANSFMWWRKINKNANCLAVWALSHFVIYSKKLT